MGQYEDNEMVVPEGFTISIGESGNTAMRFYADRIEFYTGGKKWAKVRNGILFIDGPAKHWPDGRHDGEFPSSSGTVGDIVLPNHHASLRYNTKDGLRNLPMAKGTAWNLPVFGRIADLVPNNEAMQIGSPQGLLVVGEETNRRTALFLCERQNVHKLYDGDTGLFSTKDADPGKIVVWYDQHQRHPNNDIEVGGYQIQNRTGEPLWIAATSLGVL